MSESNAATSPAPAELVMAIDNIVYEYIKKRGWKGKAKNLEEAIEEQPGGSTRSKRSAANATENGTIAVRELVNSVTPHLPGPSKDGKEPPNMLQDSVEANKLMQATVKGLDLQNILAGFKDGMIADEILRADPSDKQEGFASLERWVEGSLDMYKPEFRPMLLPIFCHFYLDLVQSGFRDSAIQFFQTFSQTLEASHSQTVHHLSALLLPEHVQNDDVAQRFRSEKYVLRMSRSGWNLLIGWLTEGVGGEDIGSSQGFSGERGNRGRMAVMRVVNDHLQVNVTQSSTAAVSPDTWEESTGLISSLVPSVDGVTVLTSAHAFNQANGQLKLGSMPMHEGLREEVERTFRDEHMDPQGAFDFNRLVKDRPTLEASDLLPQPVSFKTIDVKREIENFRNARKRIKLDPSVLQHIKDPTAHDPTTVTARSRALPSVCAYTIYEAPDGLPCCTFSPDSSLMAAGFAESYVRVWSLKGEKLKGLRSDFQASSIKDGSSLKKIREKNASSTRKLIGHSGPVYGVDFDPQSGSAGLPQYLLSCSADATARLWSLETYTNIAVYRDHEGPVWDVTWSPTGTYFATAGRDRTARLWQPDRQAAVRIYAGHLSDVDCVRFHPNSLYLATSSTDATCRLWDVQRGTCIRAFIGHASPVTALAVSPDGRLLASGGEDRSICLWDLGAGKRVRTLHGHTAGVNSLSFSAESTLLVSGGSDWTIRCWDARGGSTSSSTKPNDSMTNGESDETKDSPELLSTFPTKRTPIVKVQFTPRNLCLVSGPYIAPEYYR